LWGLWGLVGLGGRLERRVLASLAGRLAWVRNDLEVDELRIPLVQVFDHATSGEAGTGEQVLCPRIGGVGTGKELGGDAPALKLCQQAPADTSSLVPARNTDEGDEAVAEEAVLEHREAQRLARGHGQHARPLLDQATQLKPSALVSLGQGVALVDKRQVGFAGLAK
jgi:hypothetical protein